MPKFKGKSPFYPGQPVPVELFVGRADKVQFILTRGAGQVQNGKPVSIFIEGEYGIGKTSIANFILSIANRDYGIHPIYATLSGAKNIGDVGSAILRATIQSGAFSAKRSERIRDWLAKYIGEQALFGVTVHAEALKKDGPSISAGILPFFHEALERLKDTGVRGIALVFDEINGISSSPDFAYFIKGLVDENAIHSPSLPLLMIVCGVEERRREMIHCHKPIERVFEIVNIEKMSNEEMEKFFTQAYNSINIEVNESALKLMTHYSAGFPKIMHIIGDAILWLDNDDYIGEDDAVRGILAAADDVGRKFVDQQVYNSLKSDVYHSILKTIGSFGLTDLFTRSDLIKELGENEIKKLDNFLNRMKKLRVIRQGTERGEYRFISRMAQVYIWLKSSKS